MLQQVLGDQSQKVLQLTGSFTGYRAQLQELGKGYLSAADHFKQPLCGNEEGWGPLSPFRYDFTPCFIDVWVFAVAAFGVFCGSLAIWYILRKQKYSDISKDWHFWTKQSLLVLVIVDIVVQLAIQISNFPEVWYGDFRFLTTLLTLLSLGVIFTVQWLEHDRTRNANGVVLFYWLFLIIAYAVKLRSLVSQQIYNSSLAYFVTYTVGFGLSIVEFLVEWLWPKKTSAYEALVDEEEEECPVETATIFSRLTFSWMTPLMRLGYKQYLTEEDLWGLSPSDKSSTTGQNFEEAWQHQKKHKERPNLWFVLFRAYGGPYSLATVFKVINDLAAFSQPQLLRFLISFVDSYAEGKTPQPPIKGAAIAIAMFSVAVLQTGMIHQYFQLAFVTGMRIKAGLASAIYKKSLKLSNEGRSSKTTGDIVNYMAVDAQRLQDLTQFAQQVWSAPFQIIICMVSLYQLVGWSMLAGIGVMIVMIPINGVIAKLMKRLQKQQMKNKDSRSRLIAEIINNMKSIKLYAWSTAFMNKLNYVRNDLELKNLRRIGAAQAFANFTWSTTPFLVSCLTFTVFVFTQDEPLTTEIVFPALALFNLLTFPLAVLPMVITSIIEASVAVGRLTDYLMAEEIQPDAITIGPSVEERGHEVVAIRDGTFSWNRHESKDVLKHVNFTAHKGELTCVVGRVGMGKSSLLQSILGDLWKLEGEVRVNGTIAYVAQQPWIMNATVKENIIFGHRYDSNFYEKTIKACALLDDFNQLPDGDETVVGERGISLSGGQKARVALARAVYARADIYLLDDCLSAVDSHVGRHIIENVLGPKGLLSSKCRVLATNAISVLTDADFICQLRDGAIVESGTFRQLMAMKGGVAELIRTSGQDSSQSSSAASPDASGSETSTYIEPENNQDKEEIEEAQERLAELAPIKSGPSTGVKIRTGSMSTLRRASAASFQGPRGKLHDEEDPSAKTRQTKEHSEQGKVKWDAVTIYLTALIASQTAQIGGSFWLKNWAEMNSKVHANPNVGMYLGIYFAFGIGSAAFANRWLAVRLEFFGAVIILAAAGFAIISVTNHSGLSAGMVGLAMSYALQITTSLNWIVRQTVEVETNIVSVERVLEYARLPSEAPEIIPGHRPPVAWPAHGAVQFHNLSTRYREGLDLVLKNINIDIKSHEKIGVVGRTGAGKSSLTLSLFRLIEPVTGNISIDNLNTSSIGLLDLRRRLAIIPQDAALFEGTVRDNLDPGHVHDDTEIWSVLEHARLKDHVSSMEGGLEAKINEAGSNLSAGQRQLISLARAMLTPSNILVLDEATAAVDVETDRMLQTTLRSELFAHRTIITVAHRLNTILDSDRIVVLDKGEVVEFDTPQNLLKKRGIFYGLVKQAGLDTE
ncbi:putative metal resistance protein ycf1 protein [Eutypa lata UCREL1]|uniref:Putative metal resistance protein ycf1 protein n=1 Tax=Eutypa lata (strain UCR-EL1) TaxID=1287681 RepID=M7SDF6_EUTLA|nr:putative metal resistance protein ycf1 protein [Eutypa lata UCREL1]